MVKIECKENCRNSPKKQLLKDMMIASVRNNIDFCMEWLKDDVVWELIGSKTHLGKSEIKKAFTRMNEAVVIEELHIHHIITHGNTASLNGTLLLSGNESIAFCHVYEFAGFGKKAKIKTISSYIIDLRRKGKRLG